MTSLIPSLQPSIKKALIPSVHILGAPLLLEQFPNPALALSLLKISPNATNCIRVREDGGDTETDIGFDSNGVVNSAALASHCGANNGFVVTWYAQEGSINATQVTQGQQPKIYDGTTGLLLDSDSKPYMQQTTGQFMDLSATLDTTNSYITNVYEHDSSDTSLCTYGGTNDSGGTFLFIADSSANTDIQRNVGTPDYYKNTTLQSFTQRTQILSAYSDEKLLLTATDVTTSTGANRLAGYSPSWSIVGKVYEYIVWDSANVPTLGEPEVVINENWSIY